MEITKATIDLCRNARNGVSWYCYDWQGNRTPGKETLTEAGYCGACAIAEAPAWSGEAPSFLRYEED